MIMRVILRKSIKLFQEEIEKKSRESMSNRPPEKSRDAQLKGNIEKAKRKPVGVRLLSFFSLFFL
ncbi:hypothetical protein AwErysi_09300 [Erysipelotrichaceae bacterium]|nr:hypothetical protein AwErysi_09300 [Erysipelotrichaceae bacterium]